jgi:hypothetical protein
MKAVIMAAVLVLVSDAAALADHIPVPPSGVLDLQSRVATIVDWGNVDLFVEGLGAQNDVDPASRFYESLTVGGYYRVLRNLKIGAFYRVEAGALHDDDWVPHVPSPPGWFWQDTSGRLEQLLMLDVSPRFQLSFLPGKDWVLLLKARYIYDTWNGEQSILAQPELTWFWIVDRVPVLNVSASYALYFPLNFGTPPLYESYPYLTVLWHMSPELGLEIAGAYRTNVWSASETVINSGESIAGAFPVYFSSWVLSLGFVVTLSM